jgi:hypothetical protein
VSFVLNQEKIIFLGFKVINTRNVTIYE